MKEREESSDEHAVDETTAEELVAVALAVKTRGVRGEVAANLLTDFPERFEGLERLIAVNAKGERTLLALENFWLHGQRIVLKFAGYDSPETAQALVGCEFAVPESEAVALAPDEFYDWQLTSCRVETVEGLEIGQVREVLHIGGSAPILVIRRDDAKDAREQLVPLVESICVRVDIEHKLIRVDPPPGLLEI